MPAQDNLGPHYIEIEEYERTYEISAFEQHPNGTGFVVGELEPQGFILSTDSVVARKGAKSQLMEELVTYFPVTHTYVEPFGGSFKVLLYKPFRNKIEIINDIDIDIVHFFRYAVANPKQLCEFINSLPCHEAIVLGYRDGLARHELRGLERAAAVYISMAASFNGGSSGYGSSPSALIDTSIDERKLLKLVQRLKGVDIRSTGFERIIKSANKLLLPEAYPPGGVFFYLDPPYWKTSGYATHSGKSTFGWAEQVRLAELCWAIHERGNLFIQTNSDHEDLRRLYMSFKKPDGSEAFYIKRVEVKYTVSSKAEARKDTGEFIISNFPLDKQQKANQKQRGLFS